MRLLGSGATAKVELIRCSKTGALYAMKKFVNKDGRKAAREVEAFTTIKSRRYVIVYVCGRMEGIFFIIF